MRTFKLQFGLRTMLVVVTLCSLFLGALYWWMGTRELRGLLRAIHTTKVLDDREKVLFASLVWHDEQRLIKKLRLTKLRDEFSFFFVHRVCWHTTTTSPEGELWQVYVFSAFRPGGQPSVSTVVVTDSHNEVIAWNDTAYLFGAFRSAEIVAKNGAMELRVAVDPTGEPPSEFAMGTLHFRLHRKHVDDGYFKPNPLYEEELERTYQEAMAATQRRLDELMREIEAARRQLTNAGD